MCQSSLTYLYADDSALVSVGQDPNDIKENLQSDLNNLECWFKVNKLSVNVSKTNSILFCSQRSKHRNFQLDLCLDGQQLTQVNKIKYLGLHLDHHLTFEDHISNICGKISARTKLMWRIRQFIPQSLALNLYKSLIAPHFTYCSFLLEGANENMKSKLQCHQNAALRSVMNVDMSFSTTRMRTELKVDSIRTEMKKSSCKMVYKGFYNLGPNSLNQMFELYVPERVLRSGDELQVVMQSCKTAFGQKNLAYRGGLHWNSLPSQIKASVNPESLKRQLKVYNGFD